MKVLIGIDDSKFSQAAVESVAGRSWTPGTEIKVVSAVEPPFVPGAEGAGQEGNHYEIALKLIDQAIATLSLSKNHFELSGEIIEGSAKHVILDEAENWKADLIVVGSHGRRGLDRFLLGSVSQAVALHAKCSVEIVRIPRTYSGLQMDASCSGSPTNFSLSSAG